jgi:hypothetical protein
MNPEPAPKAPATPLILSETDEKLIAAVAVLKFATALDLCHFLGFSEKSLGYVRERLARLSGGGLQPRQYLLRFNRPQLGIGAREKCYAVGALGRDLIRSQGAARLSRLGHLSYGKITHDLALARVCVSVHRFCSMNPEVTLVEMRLSHDLARGAPPVPVTTNGKTTHLRVIPDALLRFERRGGGHHERFCILFELDRGTQAGAAFAEHVRARILLLVSKVYRDWFGVPGLTIAYASTGGQVRVRAMCAATIAVLAQLQKEGSIDSQETWRRLLKFTAIEYDTLLKAPLFSEVWYVPGSPDPVPLLSA